MGVLGLALAIWGTSACSSPPVYVESLKTPALVWNQQRGLCGRLRAVDGDGTLWTEPGGCEDGRPELTSRGRVEPARLEALRLAFEGLPQPAAPDPGPCNGNRDRFSKRTESGELSWATCAQGRDYDAPDALAEPFRTLAQRFVDLP